MPSVIHPIFALSIAAALAMAAPAGAQSQNQPQGPVRATRVPPPAPGSAAPNPNAAGTTVNPVTVQPQTTPQGRVVSSTDATSITSPNYSAGDAQNPPRAIGLGGNAAAGVQGVDPAPPSGVPASQAGNPRHSDIGITTVF
jgi:hypothetical protein